MIYEEIIENSMGKIVRHFKNKFYLLLFIANDIETSEKMVVYKALYDDGKIYVRALKNFCEEIPEKAINPNSQKFRFELLD